MTDGIVYIAYGEQYIEEAQRSAQSVRDTCGLPTCLVSDARADGFDDFIYLEPLDTKYPLLNKPYALSEANLPYDKFLFLDSDTHVLDDISELFELVGKWYDIGVAYGRDGIFDARFGLPYFNTGVIVANITSAKVFFSRWYMLAKILIGKYKHNDQASFYDAVFDMTAYIRFFVLPQEFNVRTSQQVALTDKAYILHGRGARLNAAIDRINHITSPRIWNGKSHDYTAEGI